MAITTARKLRIGEGFSLLALNAPAGFKKSLGDLPPSVKISNAGKTHDQVHWFVMDRTQMEKEMTGVLKLVKGDTLLWIYFPKGSSVLQTDLTRDKGWDRLLEEGDRLTWISLVSFDETWSVFGCRLKTDADKIKEKKKPEREIFKWVDPATKTVVLPDDLSNAFKKNKKQAQFFESLSFTNKKEYLEWIVTAKRSETRTERIKGTVERLGLEWKNPAAGK